MIFGLNTTSDILKLLYEISRAVMGVKFETILKYGGIYAKYHVQIMLLFVYTTTRKGFVIFTRRYFKLSWNTTALSQSNCRHFSCSSIMHCVLTLRGGNVLSRSTFWGGNGLPSKKTTSTFGFSVLSPPLSENNISETLFSPKSMRVLNVSLIGWLSIKAMRSSLSWLT